jgi:hypothetical protein
MADLTVQAVETELKRRGAVEVRRSYSRGVVSVAVRYRWNGEVRFMIGEGASSAAAFEAAFGKMEQPS